ncbi:unnamed protein product [Diplocarpon coronariae]|nr:hypothetical protein JHW43_004259 [Diplocarpon mali]
MYQSEKCEAPKNGLRLGSLLNTWKITALNEHIRGLGALKNECISKFQYSLHNEATATWQHHSDWRARKILMFSPYASALSILEIGLGATGLPDAHVRRYDGPTMSKREGQTCLISRARSTPLGTHPASERPEPVQKDMTPRAEPEDPKLETQKGLEDTDVSSGSTQSPPTAI